MVTNFVVVYDACILYSAVLRDLFVRLPITGLFKVHWTAAIHEEWIRNLLKNRPEITRKQLLYVRDLMNTHLPEAEVTGYDKYIAELQLPDQDDRHVLAAAIEVNAHIVLTYNLSDFPLSCTAQHGVYAEHPDVFLYRLLKLHPEIVMDTIQTLRRRLKRPPMTPKEYVSVLQRQLLPKTAEFLMNHLDQI